MRPNPLLRLLPFPAGDPRHTRPARRTAVLAALAAGMLLAAGPAQAQLGVGRGMAGGLGGGLGSLGGLGQRAGADGLVRRGEGTLGRELRGTVGDTADRVRRLVHQRDEVLADLLQREPQRLERLPDGRVVVRGRLLLQAPSPALQAAAQAAGFTVLRDEPLDALGLALVVLQAPPSEPTAQALARLQALDGAADADAEVDPVYLPAGDGGPALAPAASAPAAPARRPAAPPSAGAFVPGPASAPAPDAAAAAGGASPLRIGLVDGAPDAHHPALRGQALQTFNAVPGCPPGAHPDAHGTAVASLLAGQDGPFHGAAPGAALYAADLYCGDPANGSVEAVLRALAWLAAQRVPVINLSIVGPPNRLLERAVGVLVRRGDLLVAAVGNDGPASPPLYPAAYRGVIGVTGVTPRGRVLPEALQGAQVAFAAPGSAVAAAAAGAQGGDDARYRAVRGTSFAAPFVAGLLARRLDHPDLAEAAAARAALAQESVDLGARGPDPVYGAGWVGRALRVDPADLGAAAER